MMGREKFVLFYVSSRGGSAAGERSRDCDSLVDAVTTACRVNLRRGEGGRALRIEGGGRVVLDEPALSEISGEAEATERAVLNSDSALSQVALRETVFGILRRRGLVDERGKYIPPQEPRAA